MSERSRTDCVVLAISVETACFCENMSPEVPGPRTRRHRKRARNHVLTGLRDVEERRTMISVAYAGTRVIEIASTLSAGVAGRCFADLGADVVRVEKVEQLPMDTTERAVQTWARARKRVLAPRTRG